MEGNQWCPNYNNNNSYGYQSYYQQVCQEQSISHHYQNSWESGNNWQCQQWNQYPQPNQHYNKYYPGVHQGYNTLNQYNQQHQSPSAYPYQGQAAIRPKTPRFNNQNIRTIPKKRHHLDDIYLPNYDDECEEEKSETEIKQEGRKSVLTHVSMRESTDKHTDNKKTDHPSSKDTYQEKQSTVENSENRDTLLDKPASTIDKDNNTCTKDSDKDISEKSDDKITQVGKNITLHLFSPQRRKNLTSENQISSNRPRSSSTDAILGQLEQELENLSKPDSVLEKFEKIFSESPLRSRSQSLTLETKENSVGLRRVKSLSSISNKEEGTDKNYDTPIDNTQNLISILDSQNVDVEVEEILEISDIDEIIDLTDSFLGNTKCNQPKKVDYIVLDGMDPISDDDITMDLQVTDHEDRSESPILGSKRKRILRIESSDESSEDDFIVFRKCKNNSKKTEKRKNEDQKEVIPPKLPKTHIDKDRRNSIDSLKCPAKVERRRQTISTINETEIGKAQERKSLEKTCTSLFGSADVLNLQTDRKLKRKLESGDSERRNRYKRLKQLKRMCKPCYVDLGEFKIKIKSVNNISAIKTTNIEDITKPKSDTLLSSISDSGVNQNKKSTNYHSESSDRSSDVKSSQVKSKQKSDNIKTKVEVIGNTKSDLVSSLTPNRGVNQNKKSTNSQSKSSNRSHDVKSDRVSLGSPHSCANQNKQSTKPHSEHSGISHDAKSKVKSNCLASDMKTTKKEVMTHTKSSRPSSTTPDSCANQNKKSTKSQSENSDRSKNVKSKPEVKSGQKLDGNEPLMPDSGARQIKISTNSQSEASDRSHDAKSFKININLKYGSSSKMQHSSTKNDSDKETVTPKEKKIKAQAASKPSTPSKIEIKSVRKSDSSEKSSKPSRPISPKTEIRTSKEKENGSSSSAKSHEKLSIIDVPYSCKPSTSGRSIEVNSPRASIGKSENEYAGKKTCTDQNQMKIQSQSKSSSSKPRKENKPERKKSYCEEKPSKSTRHELNVTYTKEKSSKPDNSRRIQKDERNGKNQKEKLKMGDESTRNNVEEAKVENNEELKKRFMVSFNNFDYSNKKSDVVVPKNLMERFKYKSHLYTSRSPSPINELDKLTKIPIEEFLKCEYCIPLQADFLEKHIATISFTENNCVEMAFICQQPTVKREYVVVTNTNLDQDIGDRFIEAKEEFPTIDLTDDTHQAEAHRITLYRATETEDTTKECLAVQACLAGDALLEYPTLLKVEKQEIVEPKKEVDSFSPNIETTEAVSSTTNPEIQTTTDDISRDNVNQPPLNLTVNQPPLNLTVNQPPLNSIVNQPSICIESSNVNVVNSTTNTQIDESVNLQIPVTTSANTNISSCGNPNSCSNAPPKAISELEKQLTMPVTKNVTSNANAQVLSSHTTAPTIQTPTNLTVHCNMPQQLVSTGANNTIPPQVTQNVRTAQAQQPTLPVMNSGSSNAQANIDVANNQNAPQLNRFPQLYNPYVMPAMQSVPCQQHLVNQNVRTTRAQQPTVPITTIGTLNVQANNNAQPLSSYTSTPTRQITTNSNPNRNVPLQQLSLTVDNLKIPHQVNENIRRALAQQPTLPATNSGTSNVQVNVNMNLQQQPMYRPYVPQQPQIRYNSPAMQVNPSSQRPQVSNVPAMNPQTCERQQVNCAPPVNQATGSNRTQVGHSSTATAPNISFRPQFTHVNQARSEVQPSQVNRPAFYLDNNYMQQRILGYICAELTGHIYKCFTMTNIETEYMKALRAQANIYNFHEEASNFTKYVPFTRRRIALQLYLNLFKLDINAFTLPVEFCRNIQFIISSRLTERFRTSLSPFKIILMIFSLMQPFETEYMRTRMFQGMYRMLQQAERQARATIEGQRHPVVNVAPVQNYNQVARPPPPTYEHTRINSVPTNQSVPRQPPPQYQNNNQNSQSLSWENGNFRIQLPYTQPNNVQSTTVTVSSTFSPQTENTNVTRSVPTVITANTNVQNSDVPQRNVPDQILNNVNSPLIVQPSGSMAVNNVNNVHENRTENNVLGALVTPPPENTDVKPTIRLDIRGDEVIFVEDDEVPETSGNGENETVPNTEIIDLTWIDEVGHDELAEAFDYVNFKKEVKTENSGDGRGSNVISPVDSGLGSPSPQNEYVNEVLVHRVCLCKKDVKYLCACEEMWYCSEKCQRKDWQTHKELCRGKPKNLS